MPSFWISFVKDVNIGCCIIKADDHESALDTAENLKVAPCYDEAMITQMDDTQTARDIIDLWGHNRLISPDEMTEAGYVKADDIDFE